MKGFPVNRVQWAWAFYDFGNSAFLLLVSGVGFQVYFKNVLFRSRGDAADLAWALCVSLSIVASAALSPFLGALADRRGLRKPLFSVFTLAAVGFTACLSLAGPGREVLGWAFFFCANLAYTLALVLYDSFLKEIVRDGEAPRLSGFAWGLGFAGGILCWLLTLPLFGSEPDPGRERMFRLGFAGVSAFYLLFALPALIWLPSARPGGSENAHAGGDLPLWGTLRRSLGRWREHRAAFRFLLGFYFLMQVVATILYFTANYLSTAYGFTTRQILQFTVLVQAVGFPATWAAGLWARRGGPRRVLLWSVAVWTLVLAGLMLRPSPPVLCALAALLGLVIGSTQAVGRAWLAALIPRERTGEFFGYGSLTGKAAATLGVLLFGAVSSLSGSQALAWGLLLPFLAAGAWILARVPEA